MNVAFCHFNKFIFHKTFDKLNIQPTEKCAFISNKKIPATIYKIGSGHFYKDLISGFGSDM